MIMTKRFYKIITSVLVIGSLATGCKEDYLVTNPSDAVSGGTVFETTDGAYVALNGTYRTLFAMNTATNNSTTSHGNFGQKAYDLTADLMGEDMVVHSQGYGWYNAEYQYTAIATDGVGSRSDYTWFFYYKIINNANLIIANIDNASGTQADKDNVKGQALALRAYAYFNLINFFQHTYKGNETKPGVPVYTEPTSEGKGRGTVQEVYNQIVADLEQAKTLLDGKTRRHASHINQKTARAMRALVALQMEDYATAKTEAAAAKEGVALATAAQYTGGTPFNTVGGPEYIWGVQVIEDQATIYASYYSHIDISCGGYAALGTQKKITKALYDKIDDLDVRKKVFTAPGSGNTDNPALNQTKIRVKSPGAWAADYIFFRSSEQYLIEAEAAARTGDEAAAKAALEALGKARNPQYSAADLTGQALIDEILTQRRIELWGEGRSLLDITRLKKGLNRPTGDGNHNGSNLQGGSNFNIPAAALTKADQHASFLMRIPLAEINSNKALSAADQNP
jgi:hypothetical protein